VDDVEDSEEELSEEVLAEDSEELVFSELKLDKDDSDVADVSDVELI